MKLPFFVATFVGLFAAACADVPVEHAPPTGAGAGAAPTCGATPLAAGCGTTKSAVSTPSTASTTSGACKEKTCEDFNGACGTHDDGCGATFSCGACKTAEDACTPKTCTDLAVSCGNHSDGCEGIVSCGACATTCAVDADEPNDTTAQATQLGELADTDDKTITTPSLDSSDGDIDWFTLTVTDGWNFTNPKIDVMVTDPSLDVSVFHDCFSLPNYSYCDGDGAQETDPTLGNGCSALGHVVVKTDCKGDDESGTALIRIQKTVSDGSCHAYDLSVHVY